MVLRIDGVFKHDCENLKPKHKTKQWAISGSFAMLRPDVDRVLSIVVTLRQDGATNPVRKLVTSWTKEFIKDKGLEDSSMISDKIGVGGPGVTWEDKAYDKYFELLRSAKIIVTCNPAEWEGDFR